MAEDTETAWGEVEEPTVEDELRTELAQAQADLRNYKRRSLTDLERQFDAGRFEILTVLVPVLDSVAGAREHGDLEDSNPLSPVIRNLVQTLEAQGLGAIGEVGDEFDPKIHEALHVELSDEVTKPTVTEVHQRGYGTPERLLRPARVTVTQKA